MAIITHLMINYRISAQLFAPRVLNLSSYHNSITYLSSSDSGISSKFVEVMEGFNVKGPVDNVTETILEYGKGHLAEYRSQMVVAAEFLPVKAAAGITFFCKIRNLVMCSRHLTSISLTVTPKRHHLTSLLSFYLLLLFYPN